MVDVFMYMETAKLLNDKFREKKGKNPSFSIRAWADLLGFTSHGPLQQILAGKRTIPKRHLPAVVKSLTLTAEEAFYFETLVDFEKARNDEERDLYYKRLTQLRPNKNEVKMVEIENYKYFQNPLHTIVRVVMDRTDFVSDVAWIQEQLLIKVSQNEIKEVIDRLITLGLVEEENGKWRRTEESVRNKADVPSKAVQEYHRRVSKMATDAVGTQSVDDREFNSISFNIKQNKMVEAKTKMRNMLNEFLDEFAVEENQASNTYQINMQLFKLTK